MTDRLTRGLARRHARAVTVTAVLGTTVLAAACSGSSESTPKTGASTTSDSSVASRRTEMLPATPLAGTASAWRTDVSSAPVAQDSASQVANLAQQVSSRYGGVAAFNFNRYTIAYYRAAADTEKVDVAFDDCQSKGGDAPSVLTERRTGAFRSVPIPKDAVVSPGTDQELSVYSPSTDQLWDFWKAKKVDGRWQACWGGRIDDFSQNPGYFPDYTGASASGTTVEAGTLGLLETKARRVDHALTLAVPEIASQPRFSYPAQRTDGRASPYAPGAIPMGTRFRLDPSVDVDSLDLTPIAKVVARAAQQYGFIVTDSSGAVSVSAERGPATSGDDTAWQPMMDGVPGYLTLRNFPWDKLQALPQDYGKP